MADFNGCLEASSFRVRDRAAWVGDPVYAVLADTVAAEQGFLEEEAGGYWAFGWSGQYPSPVIQTYNAETEDYNEYDLLDLIMNHILPGDVCQISVSGNEKLRYIGGTVWWVSSTGISYIGATTAWDTKMTVADLRSLRDRFVESVNSMLEEKV